MKLKPPFILITATMATVIVVLILAQYLVIPYFIRKNLNTYLHENCATCRLEVGSIKSGLLFSSLTFEDVHLYWGDPKTTAIDTQVPELEISLVLTDLFKRVIRLKKISIEKPKIEIVEGDLRMKDSQSKPSEAQYVIDAIEINQANFIYIREHDGKRAPIHVDQIQGEIGQTGNTPDLVGQPTTGVLKAVLENSGAVNLKVLAHLFGPLRLNVDLKLNQFVLERMNPYFETNDGIKLAGKLVDGRSVVSINQKKLHGNVQAQYEGLALIFEKTKKRTAISAFFSNLVRALKMNAKNTDLKKRDQIQYVELEREPDETILSFIFRGMKEAALEVATSHTQR